MCPPSRLALYLQRNLKLLSNESKRKYHAKIGFQAALNRQASRGNLNNQVMGKTAKMNELQTEWETMTMSRSLFQR